MVLLGMQPSGGYEELYEYNMMMQRRQELQQWRKQQMQMRKLRMQMRMLHQGEEKEEEEEEEEEEDLCIKERIEMRMLKWKRRMLRMRMRKVLMEMRKMRMLGHREEAEEEEEAAEAAAAAAVEEEDLWIEERKEASQRMRTLQIRALVCFPLPRRCRITDSLEGLTFCNVIEELTLCTLNQSFLLEEFQPQIKPIVSFFRDCQQRVLRDDAYIDDEQERRPTVAIEWLKKVRDAAIDTKCIIDELIVVNTARHKIKKTKKRSLFNKFLLFLNDNSTATRAAIKKLESISNKINMLKHYQEFPSPERAPSSTTSRLTLGHHHDFMGWENDAEVINQYLMRPADHQLDKRTQVISIVGMSGTGKTALAHQIYSHYNVVLDFDIFAWVHSGSSQGIHFLKDTWSEALQNLWADRGAFVLTDIEWRMKMKRMLDEAVDEQKGKHIDQKALHDLLENQRFLIIIDDVITPDAWDQVKKSVPMDSHNGSRVLLTTRDTRVARHAIHDQLGSPPPHQLGPLTDAESWDLFIKVRPSPVPLDLVSIGKKIVEKCHGLPFAIEHLVHHLSTKETSYGVWLNVLESANKQLDNINEYYQTPWSYIIDMIVKDLPLELKQCLYYFGFFPKNSTIPTRRLIALWVAEGFIESRNNNVSETLEYIAEEYLKVLIDLNMVQVTKQRSNGRPKRCCLTNYLREHLFTRAKQANSCASTCVSSTSRMRNTTTTTTVGGVGRFADHPKENGAMDEYSHDTSRLLLSFLSFDYGEGSEPGERIRNLLYRGIISNKGSFQFLRVLDLERVYKPGLPKETGRLIHLTYLGLRWTYLDTFPPFISKLINLQTLDIKHTYINTLPGSIWKLRKLRHLHLNESYLDSFVHQPDADYLENLQILEGIFVDEESSVKEGLDRFTKLTRLGVSYHLTSRSQQDAMAKWIFKLDRLQSLKVRSMDRLGKLSALHLMDFTDHHTSLSQIYFLGRLEKLFQVNAFPPNLTELTLFASKLEEDPMPTLERLRKLSILRLHCDSYIGETMVGSSLGFMKLQVLEIWKLETLKIWRIENEGMPILRKLEIRCCNNLEMLPVGLQHITTIEELKLTEMPEKFIDEVKHIERTNEEWYKKAGVRFVNWNNNQNNSVCECMCV